MGLILGLSLGVGSYVLANAPAKSVKVCVAKGVVVAGRDGGCPAGAKLVRVHKRGPAGPVGPAGPPGSSGPSSDPSVIDGGQP